MPRPAPYPDPGDGRPSRHLPQAVHAHRRPDAVAAERLPGDGRADPLPPGAGIRRRLLPRPRTVARGLSDRQPGALLRRLRDGGDGVRRLQPRRSPGSRRSSPRAASSASAGLSSATPTARARPTSSSSGARRSTPSASTRRSPARRARRRAVFVTQSETSTGVVNDIRALNEVARRRGDDPLRRRDLRARRRRPAAGRMGRRRRRLRLAEVAHVPAGPRLRLGVRARDGARRREAGRALLLRLGEDGEGPGAGPAELGVHPGGDACSWASTSRWK